MDKGSSRGQVFVIGVAAAIGGVFGSLFTALALPSNAETKIARFKEIRLTGPTGKDQIVMKVSSTGPKISLLGKDGKQELLLEVTDTPNSQNAPAKMAGIHFIDLTKKETVVKIVSEPNGFASLRLGLQGLGNENIFAFADSSASASGSYLGVGKVAHDHFEVSSVNGSVNLKGGGLEGLTRLQR